MDPIKFHVPYVTGKELGYIEAVLASRQFAGNGAFTRRCQTWLQERYGVPHVLLTHSCTAALEVAALLLDLGPGDEVVLPSYTFVSTASAFLRTGCKLVFCEVDPGTMTMDLADVARRLTPQTKAVIPVDYGGIGVDVPALRRLCDPRGIVVVEDAAQGLEARLDGHALGTQAPLATFSFHETKNVHAGLGGALFLNDASYFDRAEDIWERGTDRGKMFKGLVDKYSWVELGSSFYPAEIQAAFLWAQLEHIEANTAERQVIYDTYAAGLADLAAAGHFALPRVTAGMQLNAHSFFLLLPSVADADRLRVGLVQRGVHAFIGYVPLHSSRMGQKLGYRADDLPVTEAFAHRVLRLPLHNSMTRPDAERVVATIGDVLRS